MNNEKQHYMEIVNDHQCNDDDCDHLVPSDDCDAVVNTGRLNRKVELSKFYNHSDSNTGDYAEPFFAKILRGLGCCVGYSCIACFGGWCGSCCYPYKTVDIGSQAVIQEFGRVKREVREGMHYVNPMTEKLRVTNMKTQVIDLGRQNVMTLNKLPIDVESVVFYKIVNTNRALFRVEDLHHAIVELSYTTLRNVIGSSTLDQCLNRKETSKKIKEEVDKVVQKWGITIEGIQIKDIHIPKEIQTSLFSAEIAERDARAKIITANANVEVAELIRKQSDVVGTKSAMQIRSLEVINNLCHSPNTKVVLLPSDLNLESAIGGVAIN